ncbi:MAG: diheme cytochrome C-type [Alphaproteobacteria bacterium]|nr:diheme cytochrome C-type [Alphaproteobacteria bacterium]
MPATVRAQSVERGQYLFQVSGGCSCHTDVKNQGALMAGGRALATPFGTFYSPNVTPDRDTGLGTWAQDDFVRAMRDGEAPDGRHLFPAFPFASFTGMTDPDLADLWAYLRTIPAIAAPNRDHELDAPFGWRFLLPLWTSLYLEQGPLIDDPERSASWNRGRYLVEALAHCGECHTPRDLLGGMDRDRWLAGTADGPEGGSVPNITPDPETGIGAWSDDAIRRVLRSGMLPDGDFVGGAMAEAGESFRHLTDADLDAIVTYLRGVPAIVNQVTTTKPAASSSAWE